MIATRKVTFHDRSRSEQDAKGSKGGLLSLDRTRLRSHGGAGSRICGKSLSSPLRNLIVRRSRYSRMDCKDDCVERFRHPASEVLPLSQVSSSSARFSAFQNNLLDLSGESWFLEA